MDGFRWVLLALQYLAALDPPRGDPAAVVVAVAPTSTPTDRPALARFGFKRPLVIRETPSPKDYAGLDRVELRAVGFQGPCDRYDNS